MEASSERVTKCVSLLQHVPDSAVCFGPEAHWPAEVHLALAVLRGQFGAAAALADEVIGNHLRPEPSPYCKARIGTAHLHLVHERAEWGRVFSRGKEPRVRVTQTVYERTTDRWTLVWTASLRSDARPVCCDFDPRDPQGLNTAKAEVAAAFDAHYFGKVVDPATCCYCNARLDGSESDICPSNQFDVHHVPRERC